MTNSDSFKSKVKYVIVSNLIQESLLGLDLNSESSEQSVIEQVQADIEGVYDFNHFNMGDEYVWL